MNDWMPCAKLERRSTAPKQAKQPKRRRPRRIGRAIGRLIGLALLVLITVLVMRKVARPFVLCYDEGSSVNEISRELNEVNRENQELLQKKVYLASIEGAQIEARKLGWVMPGERSIVLENRADQPEEAAAKKESGVLNWIKSKLGKQGHKS